MRKGIQVTNKKSPAKRIIKSKNSYVEGSVKLEKGDFVGGNKVNGYSLTELTKFMEAYSKVVSPKYLDPEQFTQAFNKFKNYHEALREWKELHNGLDEILGAFNQFYIPIQSLRNTPRKAIPNDLKARWFPVSKKINELLNFSREIEIIGEPFQEVHGRGASWAIDFYNIEKEMKSVLEEAVLSRNPFIGKPSWWIRLLELSGNSYDTILNHLHMGDKKLRETAMDLYYLSEKVFQRQET